MSDTPEKSSLLVPGNSGGTVPRHTADTFGKVSVVMGTCAATDMHTHATGLRWRWPKRRNSKYNRPEKRDYPGVQDRHASERVTCEHFVGRRNTL